MIALRRKHKPFWGMKLWDESRDKLYRGRASRDEEWSSVMIAWWGFQRWLLCRGVFSCMCVYMYVYVEWGISEIRELRPVFSLFFQWRIACVIYEGGFLCMCMLSEVAEDLENEGRHKGAGDYKTEIF